MKITVTDDLHGTRFDSYAISVQIPENFRPMPSFEQILKTIWVDMVQKRSARHKADPNARVIILKTAESDDAQPREPESAERIVYDNMFEGVRRLQILENWCVPYTVGMRFITDYAMRYPLDMDYCEDMMKKLPAPAWMAKPFSIVNDSQHGATFVDAIEQIRRDGFDAKFILHEDFVETLLHVHDPENSGQISSGSIMIYASNLMEMMALLDESNPIDNTLASQLWVSIRALIKFASSENLGAEWVAKLRKDADDVVQKLRDYSR